METKHYILSRIEGEYAYLKDTESDNEIFIAMALLPQGADIGSKIKCEMFCYTLEQTILVIFIQFTYKYVSLLNIIIFCGTITKMGVLCDYCKPNFTFTKRRLNL